MGEEKIICDTDVMIDYWDVSNPRHSATVDILENKIGLDNVIISAITKMELLRGARNKSEMIKINKKLSRFNVALINNEITEKAIELLQRFYLSHGLHLPDSLIAATALITEIELFTYNSVDFKFIPKLKLYR